MARSNLTKPTIDLFSDDAILFSLVEGEQLEVPIQLTEVIDPSLYTYECVVMEANNIPGQTTVPSDVMIGGHNVTVNVRVPALRGTWNPATAYSVDDVVLYNGVYYYLFGGVSVISSTLPTNDPNWIPTTINTVYIQIPSSLISTWSVQPTVSSTVYGFIEVRVTETTGTFPQTWKPVRGLVAIAFSPTDEV